MYLFVLLQTSSPILSHFQILLKHRYLTAAKFEDLAKFVSFAGIFFYYFFFFFIAVICSRKSSCASKALGCIGHCRNVRGLGKSLVVFRLFELLRCSNERDQLNLRIFTTNSKYLKEEHGKMVALEMSPKIESLYGLGRQAKKL